MPAPAARVSPNSAIALIMLMKTFEKEGARGMLPACCLLLWGREGVTLRAAAGNTRITGKKDSHENRIIRIKWQRINLLRLR